ncbi:MAG: hypothetical protein COB24_06930 [Hyphomicrobiales bacterium]|nr:MAG: hypothetical protein COB24_06930 [Hyphomicrobiales bacterium]
MTAAAADVSTTAEFTQTNATNQATFYDDTISSSSANMVNSSINGREGTDSLTITGALGGFTFGAAGGAGALVVNVENIIFGDGANTITGLDSAVKNITGGTGADDITITGIAGGGTISLGAGTDTLQLGAGTYTGIYNFGAAADTIELSGVTDISGVTITGLTGENFTLTGATTTTMTDSQFDTIVDGATVTAANAANAITISDTATMVVSGGERAIETFTLASTGNDSIEIVMADADAILGNITITAGGNDTIILDNATVEGIEATDYITVTGFTAGGGDRLTVQVANTTHDDGYQSVVGAGQNLTVATDSVIELTGSNSGDLTDVSDGGDVETIIAAAIADSTSVGVADVTFIVYDGANAGIYTANITVSDADLATGEFELELIAILNGVGADALTSSDFF